MFHAGAQKLIDHWNRLREGPEAPRRADFSPMELASLAPQLFMLDQDDRFRLVGGQIAELHQHDLRGSDFLSLWRGVDTAQVAAALTELRRAVQPVVISATAHTDEGYETRVEIALAPFAGADGRIDRIVGLYQPTSSLTRLLGRPVERLSLTGWRLATETQVRSFSCPVRPRRELKLVVLDGRRVA